MHHPLCHLDPTLNLPFFVGTVPRTFFSPGPHGVGRRVFFSFAVDRSARKNLRVFLPIPMPGPPPKTFRKSASFSALPRPWPVLSFQKPRPRGHVFFSQNRTLFSRKSAPFDSLNVFPRRETPSLGNPPLFQHGANHISSKKIFPRVPCWYTTTGLLRPQFPPPGTL